MNAARLLCVWDILHKDDVKRFIQRRYITLEEIGTVGPFAHRLTSLQSGDRFGLGVVKMLTGGERPANPGPRDPWCDVFFSMQMADDEPFFFEKKLSLDKKQGRSTESLLWYGESVAVGSVFVKICWKPSGSGRPQVLMVGLVLLLNQLLGLWRGPWQIPRPIKLRSLWLWSDLWWLLVVGSWLLVVCVCVCGFCCFCGFCGFCFCCCCCCCCCCFFFFFFLGWLFAPVARKVVGCYWCCGMTAPWQDSCIQSALCGHRAVKNGGQKTQGFWRFTFYDLRLAIHTVDGWNLAPPHMYETRVNNGINYL